MAVYSSNKYSVIALEQQFQTLRRGYTPGNVSDIKVSDFVEDKENGMHLSAMLSWKPPPGNILLYQKLCGILDYPTHFRNIHSRRKEHRRTLSKKVHF